RDRQVLLRRAVRARLGAAAAANSLDGGPDSAVRRRGARARAAATFARLPGAAALVLGAPSGPCVAGFALARNGHRRASLALVAARPSHESAAAAHARRDRIFVELRRSRAVATALDP